MDLSHRHAFAMDRPEQVDSGSQSLQVNLRADGSVTKPLLFIVPTSEFLKNVIMPSFLKMIRLPCKALTDSHNREDINTFRKFM
jgi:hypothetical protein